MEYITDLSSHDDSLQISHSRYIRRYIYIFPKYRLQHVLDHLILNQCIILFVTMIIILIFKIITVWYYKVYMYVEEKDDLYSNWEIK